MSQQKIIAALCFVCVLVVVARAAEVTTSGCLQAVQAIQGSYPNQLRSVAEQFARQFMGSPNFDVDAFMKEVNQILAGYMNLASPQTNLSPRAIYDTFTGLVGSQISLFTRYAFNAGFSLDAIRGMNQALTNIMNLNMDTLTSVTAACLPSSL